VQPGIRAYADPTRIAQILTNLLSNAAKFTPAGLNVKVELEEKDKNAVVRVIDSGVGIPEDQIERIFTMFTRIEKPGMTTQPGLGIGLALARRLAEMHGARLTASSAGHDRGATFTLSLPLQSAAHAPTKNDDPITAGSPDVVSALKVVLIEDNPDILEIMSEWLRDLGHEVWEASTGLAGIDLIKMRGPDLVLCDLGLPDLDGVEICRRIRALPLEDGGPVMVALTGWGRDEDRSRTRLAGFDHHLVKPVKSQQLHRVLEAVTSAAAAGSWRRSANES